MTAVLACATGLVVGAVVGVLTLLGQIEWERRAEERARKNIIPFRPRKS